MRKYILIVLGLLTAGPAFAQNTVNGVDLNGDDYRRAYLAAVSDSRVCNVNLYQRTGYQGGGIVAVVPLWDSNRAQALACERATGGGSNGGRRNAADGSVS
ncbi:MAG TPA: hypothetical protein VD994_10575 [Prosthecobacter sp.]|nr:hypothetical protein [Prosthecobacter sp.]